MRLHLFALTALATTALGLPTAIKRQDLVPAVGTFVSAIEQAGLRFAQAEDKDMTQDLRTLLSKSTAQADRFIEAFLGAISPSGSFGEFQQGIDTSVREFATKEVKQSDENVGQLWQASGKAVDRFEADVLAWTM